MLPERIDIKGIALPIDSAVQEICETSNATSSSTRSVLYILVIVTILAFLAALNTFKYNWTKGRIALARKEVILYANALELDKKIHFLSPINNVECTVRLEAAKRDYENNSRNYNDNYKNVRIPILNISFDVNHLWLVFGTSAAILLIIIKFTLEREVNNLKIALNSISERYPPNADAHVFEEDVKELYSNETSVIASINYTRRQHHYNYLSMNEIFNLPPSDYINYNYNSWEYKILMKMFWLPSVVYLFIFANDVITIDLGVEINREATYSLIASSALFSILVMLLAYKCTKQKAILFFLYKHFRDENYFYENALECKSLKIQLYRDKVFGFVFVLSILLAMAIFCILKFNFNIPKP